MSCRLICVLIAWLSLPTYGDEALLDRYLRIRQQRVSIHGKTDPASQSRKAELRAQFDSMRHSIATPNVANSGPTKSHIEEFVLGATLLASKISQGAAKATQERYESLLLDLQANGVDVGGLKILNAAYTEKNGPEIEFPMLAGYAGPERDAKYVLIPLARGSEFGARYAGAHFGEAMDDLLAHNELARGSLRYVDPDSRETLTRSTFSRFDRFVDRLSLVTGIAGGVILTSAALAATATFAPALLPAALGGLATTLAKSVGSLTTLGLVTGLTSLGIQIKWNADRAMGGKKIDWAGLAFATAGTALMGLGKIATTIGTRLGIAAAGFGLDGAELRHGIKQARRLYRREAPFLNPDQRMRLAVQLIIQSIVDGATRVLFNLDLLDHARQAVKRFWADLKNFTFPTLGPSPVFAAAVNGESQSSLDWNRSFQSSDSDVPSGKNRPQPKVEGKKERIPRRTAEKTKEGEGEDHDSDAEVERRERRRIHTGGPISGIEAALTSRGWEQLSRPLLGLDIPPMGSSSRLVRQLAQLDIPPMGFSSQLAKQLALLNSPPMGFSSQLAKQLALLNSPPMESTSRLASLLAELNNPPMRFSSPLARVGIAPILDPISARWQQYRGTRLAHRFLDQLALSLNEQGRKPFGWLPGEIRSPVTRLLDQIGLGLQPAAPMDSLDLDTTLPSRSILREEGQARFEIAPSRYLLAATAGEASPYSNQETEYLSALNQTLKQLGIEEEVRPPQTEADRAKFTKFERGVEEFGEKVRLRPSPTAIDLIAGDKRVHIKTYGAVDISTYENQQIVHIHPVEHPSEVASQDRSSMVQVPGRAEVSTPKETELAGEHVPDSKPKKKFNFDLKFGWGEVIGLATLAVAIATAVIDWLSDRHILDQNPPSKASITLDDQYTAGVEHIVDPRNGKNRLLVVVPLLFKNPKEQTVIINQFSQTEDRHPLEIFQGKEAFPQTGPLLEHEFFVYGEKPESMDELQYTLNSRKEFSPHAPQAHDLSIPPNGDLMVRIGILVDQHSEEKFDQMRISLNTELSDGDKILISEIINIKPQFEEE